MPFGIKAKDGNFYYYTPVNVDLDTVVENDYISDLSEYVTEYGTNFGLQLQDCPENDYLYIDLQNLDPDDPELKYLWFYKYPVTASFAQMRFTFTDDTYYPKPPYVLSGALLPFCIPSTLKRRPYPIYCYVCYYPADADSIGAIQKTWVVNNTLFFDALSVPSQWVQWHVRSTNAFNNELDKVVTTFQDYSDPYSVPGTSYPAGGDGTFDFSSTDIPIPGLPTISAANTGFCALYNPSDAGMRALANYLWSGSFDPENFRKIMANPMDAILGCHIIPVISGHPATAPSELYVGNVSTGITMSRFTEQYYSLDCGTINMLEKWGSYLDYSPYTKVQLYLPYIGFVNINIDDFMAGSIKVEFHVDIVSGAVCAFVYCVNKDGMGHTVYSYSGACACDVPITAGQYTNAVYGMLNLVGSLGQTALSASIGSTAGVTSGLQNAANAAMSMSKPEITRSGSFGGSSGLMGVQYPYLILESPRMCTPGQQNKFIGYPSFMTVQMSQLKGYTEIDVNHLNNMTCTANENDEILNLLKGGVIF